MDIKNVNDFFSRKKINVYPERLIFKYITDELKEVKDNSDEELGRYLETIPLKSETNQDDELEDEVFRSLHLVRSLNNLDERDFDKFQEGKVDTLKDLVDKEESKSDESDSSLDEDSDYESESDSDDESPKKEWKDKETVLKGKKHEDKDEKKARKKAAQSAKQEKRKTKMKKHVKKKIINKRKN
ncbi:hypothetical protein QCA50_019622 [Cerrena zonata]